MLKAEGMVFGRLTVTKRVNRYDSKYKYVEAVCECGTVKEYRFSNLTDGRLFSCGCYKRAFQSRRGEILREAMAPKIPLDKLAENPVHCKEILEAFGIQSAHRLVARYVIAATTLYYSDSSAKGVIVFSSGEVQVHGSDQIMDYYKLQSVLSKYTPV